MCYVTIKHYEMKPSVFDEKLATTRVAVQKRGEIMENTHRAFTGFFWSIILMILLSGCSSAYYGAMEKMGKHKRDIMVDRVESARDSQKAAQEQFKSALERFDSVVKLEETNLKKAYDSLSSEYDRCEDAAARVSSRIEQVEDVAEALFDEWEDELNQYQSKELRRSSKEQMRKTRTRYETMVSSMHHAEKSMEPVLRIFKDNVLFLKHNLNAQAIGSLQSEFANLKGEIDTLLVRMNAAIESSDQFIADIK